MRAFTICALAALGIACAGSPDAGQSDVIGSDNCGDSVTVELPATVDARIDGPGRFDIREAAADSPYRAELRVEVEEELWDEVLAEELISCACDPPVVFLTINDIPALMNGSEPYLSNSLKMEEFRIAVPTSGFAWNLTVDCPCGCTSAGISVIADAPAGVLEAGESLFGLFEDLGDGKYHWLVGPEHEFAPGPGLTVSAQIMDLCGNLAGPEALTVLVAESTPELDPFDLEDPWLLVYKRDDYSIHVEVDEAGKGLVVSEPEPNGTYDLLEDLWTVGVGTPEPLPEFEQIVCGDFTGGNECLARELLERVREEAYGNFACGADGTKTEESINVRFWIEGEPGAPDPADFAYQFLELYLFVWTGLKLLFAEEVQHVIISEQVANVLSCDCLRSTHNDAWHRSHFGLIGKLYSQHVPTVGWQADVRHEEVPLALGQRTGSFLEARGNLQVGVWKSQLDVGFEDGLPRRVVFHEQNSDGTHKRYSLSSS